MFEYLRGEVQSKRPEYLALDVNGVGYKIFISLKTYEKIQVEKEEKLYIYNYIKEDAFKLIGFIEEKDRTIFEMLLSVSGIGVSLALAILSSFEIREIKRIVIEEDFKTLKTVPKLGEKKSKQIILDLKNKMTSLNIISLESHEKIEESVILEEELYLALSSLGYNKKEIDKLISREEIREIKNIETAIKFVLKKIRDKK